MLRGMDDDINGRVRGRTAGLRRSMAARLKLIAAATIVGGFALSLAMTFSGSAGKHFEYALLGEFYGLVLLLGGLLALSTWWRYRASVRRLPGVLARSTGQSEVTSTRPEGFYSKGSLAASTDWEKPSVAGEEDQGSNRQPR